MRIINPDNVVIIDGDNRTTYGNTVAERQVLEREYPEIYAEVIKVWQEPIYPTAEEIAEMELQAQVFQTETTNRRSLEETLVLLQDEMRAWKDVPNNLITDADVRKGIKLVMRVLIKLIRLVLNKLEETE